MSIIKKAVLRYCTPIVLVIGSVTMHAYANETDAEISLDDKKISVVANQAKLSEILLELGKQTDITVTDAETISGTFDGEVVGESMESVLYQLGVNSIFVWNSSDNDRSLTEIIVLSVSEEDSQFLPTGETVEVAASNQENAIESSVTDSGQASQAGAESTTSASTTSAESADVVQDK